MTASYSREPPSTLILGLRVHHFTEASLHECIGAVIEGRRRALIANANVHALNLACRDAGFRRVLHRADYVFCDGAGVRLAARLLGHSMPPRITYADWLPRLGAFCAERGFRLFLLGGRPGVAEEAARRLREYAPALPVAGCHDGYFDKDPGSDANREVVALVNRSSAHVLLVCFGMPAQELWLARHWDELSVNVGLTGGAALDYVSGRLRRPPRWMTRCGLEWLGRLIIEPGRLWRRYLIGNPLFFLRLMRYHLRRGDEENAR